MDVTTKQKAWEYIQDRLFYPPTRLLYDRPVNTLDHFPTPNECAANDPNPCGYGTGMEDCMISGATMLETCLLQPATKDSAAFAHQLADGLLRCAESAKSAGFLPRGLTPVDGKSHYIDSSRDQYTMFLYAMHLYQNSALCTDTDRRRIRTAILAMANRAKTNVTPENGYDLLREDGGRSLCSVIWGERIDNHEAHRLPMFYAAAYEVSGDKEWLERYLALRQDAMQQALPMKERYYHLYTLQQMLASLTVCRDIDPDPAWKAQYATLMQTVATYALSQVPNVEQKLRSRDNFNLIHGDFRRFPLREQTAPNEFKVYQNRDPGDTDSFYLLQDAPNIVIACRMAGLTPSPQALALCRYAFSLIDFDSHHRATPIHFLNAAASSL